MSRISQSSRFETGNSATDGVCCCPNQLRVVVNGAVIIEAGRSDGRAHRLSNA
jgi:hypothetical protein